LHMDGSKQFTFSATGFGSAADTGLGRFAAGRAKITDGSTGYGSLLIGDGSAANPSLSFGSDDDGSGMGIYRSATNNMSFAVNGTPKMTLDSTSLSFSGSTIVTGGGNAFYGFGRGGVAVTADGTESVALITRTLPTAAISATYRYIVQDADGLKIVAAAGDTIRIGPSYVTAAAGYIQSYTPGATVTLQGVNATEWHVTDITGDWSSATWDWSDRKVGDSGYWYAVAQKATQSSNSFVVTGASAPSASGTGSSVSATSFVAYTTAASSASQGGLSWSNAHQLSTNPKYFTTFRVPSGQSTYRLIVGFSQTAATSGAADDATINHAVLVYNPATHTNYQCVTNDGTAGGTITDSGVAFAADTTVRATIEVNNTTDARFYINGTRVCTHTTNLSGNNSMVPTTSIFTLEAVAKVINVGRNGTILDNGY
jgi:hypothetical protein